jgi:hypothetical protein
LIVFLRECGGLVRLKVAKSGISQINGFPATSAHSSSVREQDNIETRLKDDPA